MDILVGALVGKGNTADIFDIDDNKVVKLFHAGYSKSCVENEYLNSKLINKFDIPMAKSYEMIIHEGRYGIIYDKIKGTSLLDIIFSTNDIEKCTTILALMHKKILCNKSPNATSYKTILYRNIEDTDAFSKEIKSKLVDILNNLPESDNLCHGDLHFGNIIVNQNGYYVIDFMNLCRGHKNFDIARTIYLLEMTPLQEETPNKEKLIELRRQITNMYLNKMEINRESVANFLTIIVAARVAELGDNEKIERNMIIQYLLKQGLL